MKMKMVTEPKEKVMKPEKQKEKIMGEEKGKKEKGGTVKDA